MFPQWFFWGSLLLCCLFMQKISAQSAIHFEQGTWEEALAKAENSKKMVFVGFCAPWGITCKMMDETFADPKVAAFYNTHFINFKIDTEKGEGEALAKRYKVEGLATLLFVDVDGEIVYRVVGYRSSDSFIELGEKAISLQQYVRDMNTLYNHGERAFRFMEDYLMLKSTNGDPNLGDIADEYLEETTTLSRTARMDITMKYASNPESKGIAHLLDNRKAYNLRYGAEVVDWRLEQILLSALRSEKWSSEEASNTLVTRFFPNGHEEKGSLFRMLALETQPEAFADAAVKHYARFPSKKATELNEVAWYFYEHVDNKDHLRVALEWAKKSVDLDKTYDRIDTVAALYYKLGDKENGKKMAESAIKLAKASGKDYANTEKLMKKYE
jgi:thioredoxin-related protein